MCFRLAGLASLSRFGALCWLAFDVTSSSGDLEAGRSGTVSYAIITRTAGTLFLLPRDSAGETVPKFKLAKALSSFSCGLTFLP